MICGTGMTGIMILTGTDLILTGVQVTITAPGGITAGTVHGHIHTTVLITAAGIIPDIIPIPTTDGITDTAVKAGQQPNTVIITAMDTETAG